MDMPSIGGLNIFIGTTFFFFFYNSNLKFLNIDVLILWIFITSLFIIGLIDDYINLSPFKKLFYIVYFLLLLFYQDHRIIIEFVFSEVLDTEITLGLNAIFFSTICVVFLINALNFLDGIDGIFLTYSLSIVLLIIIINFSVFLVFWLLIYFYY